MHRYSFNIRWFTIQSHAVTADNDIGPTVKSGNRAVDAFEQCAHRRLLRVSWEERITNQSALDTITIIITWRQAIIERSFEVKQKQRSGRQSASNNRAIGGWTGRVFFWGARMVD